MVLVTGGTGFVGSHVLLCLLEHGENVRVVYRGTAQIGKTRSLFGYYQKESLFDRISWVEADITDVPALEKAFQGITSVYHCAALVSFDPADEEKLRKVNIEGTANVVNLALAYGIAKFCHVSSIAALGDLYEFETTVTEETEWNPEKYHSDYAISKHGAEMEIWRAQQEGLNAVIVNPGIIIGPGFSGGSGEIFASIAKGFSYYTKGTAGFTTIDDVVGAMYALMQKNAFGERYIIVNENIEFNRLTRSIAGYMGVKAPGTYAPKWLTAIAWRLDGMLSALFSTKRKLSKAMARSLHSTDLYSNQKITRALDLKFEPMDPAIKITSDYYLNRN